MPKSDSSEALVYYSEKGPDVPELCKAYENTIANLSDYFSQCRNSYNERRNEWPGKQDDLRKGGANAFPWKGASDTEAHVISERIDTYVSLCMTALTRANIRAYPVEANDMAQAKVVSSFLKWMIAHYIPRFQQEMEQAANHLFERGLMVTYVGWERHESSYLQSISLQEIADAAPDLARLILEGSNDDQIVALLQGVYGNLTTKRGKKALNQLRKKGVAEIPVTRRKVDRPCVKACSPDGEVFFPPYCMDPQKAPYVFYKTLMTAQEIESKVVSEGWDREWADYVIENCKGVETLPMGSGNVMARREIVGIERPEDLYEVVRGYQRLIDMEDGGQGIYCTVFHPNYSGTKPDVPAHAKFELLNGFEDYPFIVTRLAEDDKRMYDVITVPEKLRGLQWQVKVERDSRVDRNGLATVPPLLHPVGKPPTGEWAPGGRIGRTRREDFEFAPVPSFNPGSVEMEQTMLQAADKIMGLDMDNPLSTSKRQFYLDKFLAHIRDVIKAAFQAFQRFGPDQVFFTVTGVADPQKFQKGSADEDFNLLISFDVQNFDPEADDKGVEQFLQILPYDKNGRINIDTLVEALAYRIDPVLADAMLQPVEVAQQKVLKDVTDDLAHIAASIEAPARPNGAQVAIGLIEQYASQPDVAERIKNDSMFAERLKKYYDQYAFMLQQTQNAEIGRIGTKPANVGSVTTQYAQ